MTHTIGGMMIMDASARQGPDHQKVNQRKYRNNNLVTQANKEAAINSMNCSDFINDQELDLMTNELAPSGRIYPENVKA